MVSSDAFQLLPLLWLGCCSSNVVVVVAVVVAVVSAAAIIYTTCCYTNYFHFAAVIAANVFTLHHSAVPLQLRNFAVSAVLLALP